MGASKKKLHHIEEAAQSLKVADGYPWEEQFQLVVSEFGIAPSEYWQMTPAEVALIVDAKRPKHIGGIHENDLADMLQRRQELSEKGVKLL